MWNTCVWSALDSFRNKNGYGTLILIAIGYKLLLPLDYEINDCFTVIYKSLFRNLNV